MLGAGIILFILGYVVRIWVRISSDSETRAISPQPVGVRAMSLRLIKQSKRRAHWESITLIIVGAFLILIYGVFN